MVFRSKGNLEEKMANRALLTDASLLHGLCCIELSDTAKQLLCSNFTESYEKTFALSVLCNTPLGASHADLMTSFGLCLIEMLVFFSLSNCLLCCHKLCFSYNSSLSVV